MSRTLLPTVSKAGQWIECPASFKAQIEYPQLDKEPRNSALEGRSCHTMLEELRAGKTLTPGSLDEKHGVVRSLDMIEAVYECYNVTPVNAVLESKIDLSSIYSGWYGYCDAYAVSDVGILDVYDFKFGHTHVAVEENIQLIAYALGIIHLYKLESDVPVNLHIVQPREYRSGVSPHRTWSTSVGELLNYIPLLQSALNNAMSNVPVMTTGSHCKYCSARAHCKAFRDSQYDWLEYSNSLSLEHITNDQISVDLTLITRALEQLQFAKTALEEQTVHKIKNGEQVKGYALDTVAGRKRWKTGSEEQIISIGNLFGVEVTKTELLTPNQVEKLGVDKVVISSYIENPSSLKLVTFNANDYAKLFK